MKNDTSPTPARSQKFRKKPVVIEAVLWDNSMEVYTFIYKWTPEPVVSAFHPNESLSIKTLEGWLTASKGDWVIKGVKGELYACKPDIFAMTYEPAEATPVSETADSTPTTQTVRYDVLAQVHQRLHDMKNLQRARAWPHVEGVAMAEKMVAEMMTEAHRARR